MATHFIHHSSFPSVPIHPAHRQSSLECGLDTSVATASGNNDTTTQPPTTLQRRPSVMHQVLVIHTPNDTDASKHTIHIWLQRKIRTSRFGGSIRVGFVLTKKQQQNNSILTVHCTDDNTAQMVTVRMEDKSLLNNNNFARQLAATQYVMQHLRQPFDDTHVDGGGKSFLVGQDKTHLYVITDYQRAQNEKSTLLQVLCPVPKERVAKDYMVQIIAGLQSLQRLGLYHGNLNLETIRVVRDDDDANTMCCTIGGLEGVVKVQQQQSPNTMRPMVTNMMFAAPEVWRSEPVVTAAVDVWSLGVILFCLLHGPVEYGAGCFDLYQNKVQQCSVTNSDAAQSLLQALLHRDPQQRPTLEQVAQHAWLQEEGA